VGGREEGFKAAEKAEGEDWRNGFRRSVERVLYDEYEAMGLVLV